MSSSARRIDALPAPDKPADDHDAFDRHANAPAELLRPAARAIERQANARRRGGKRRVDADAGGRADDWAGAGSRSPRPSSTASASGNGRREWQAKDAEPAHLEQPGERRRWRGRHPRSISTRSSATSAKPWSSRRSSRSDLPDPGGPISSTPFPSRAAQLAWICIRNAFLIPFCREGKRPLAAAIVSRETAAAKGCYAAFGRRTVKRAPRTWPSPSCRFSALIRPWSASTIWRLIESPRPECWPKCSPSGRSE